MNETILLIEDNPEIQKTNRRMLELKEYKVYTASSIYEANKCISREIPDLIILDIMLPDGSGFDFCKELHNKYPSVPVLILSVLAENSDIIEGLKTGGDGYLTKPYDYEVFLAYIEALLRRSPRSGTRNVGPFKIDYTSQRVYRGETDLLLKPREFALLRHLIENPGVYFHAEELYKNIWAGEALEDVRTVYAHVSSLRRKLDLYGDSGIIIDQKRGRGYRLVTEKITQ